jgi:hypothetical protein
MDTMAGIVFRIHELQGQREAAVAKAGDIRQKIIGPEGEAAGMAGKLLDAVKSGKATPEQRRELADRFRRAGAEGLARTTESTSPQEMERQDLVDTDFAESDEQYKAIKKVNQERRERARKKAAAAKRAATQHEQEVKAQADIFDNDFIKRRGVGSLDSAIIIRAQAGQTSDRIKKDLTASMSDQLAGKVPPNLVAEVSAMIVNKAVDGIRSEVASAGGGDAGIESVAVARASKIDRAREAANNHAAAQQNRAEKQQAAEFESGLAGDIFGMTGGAINPQGAMAAAHRAVQSMRRGVDIQTATMEAIVHTMGQLSGMGDQILAEQMRVREQLGGVHRQLQMQGAQARRQRAQRPGILPQF